MPIYFAKLASPLGPIVLASEGSSLSGLWFEGQRYFPDWVKTALEAPQLPIFIQTEHWLRLYFHGQDPGPLPPLSPAGTDFQKRVWEALLTIPYGTVTTYGDLAKRLGIRSAQAVGGAVEKNPISILIPCHRCLGAKGALTGYAGGLEKKGALLRLEKERKPLPFLEKCGMIAV